MPTAYIAAGEIKDILSDTAHILLFGEDRNVFFLGFLRCSEILKYQFVLSCRQKSMFEQILGKHYFN